MYCLEIRSLLGKQEEEATELIGQTCLVWMVEVLEMMLSIGDFILKEIEEVLAVNSMPKKRECSIRRRDCSHDLPRRVNALTHRTFGGQSEMAPDRESFATMEETQSAPPEGDASIRHSSNAEGTESYDDSSSETVGEHLRVKKRALTGKITNQQLQLTVPNSMRVRKQTSGSVQRVSRSKSPSTARLNLSAKR